MSEPQDSEPFADEQTSTIENPQYRSFIDHVYDLLPVETKAGIIGGMIIPVIAVLGQYVVTYGEPARTGDSLLFGLLIVGIIAGAVVSAISGTIVGTFAHNLIQHLSKAGNQRTQKLSGSDPELWHTINLPANKAAPSNRTWTWVKRNSAVIGGFIGGLLPWIILLLWGARHNPGS